MRFAKVLMAVSALAAASLGALGIGAAVAQSTQSPVLVINTQKVISESKAGADMDAKVKALIDRKNTEFRTTNQAVAQSLETEARALQPLLQGKTEAQVMADAALKGRYEAHMRRQQDLAVKGRLQELSQQATIQQAQRQLLGLLDPIVDQIMTQRGAVVVLDATQTAKVRPSVDITAEAATRYNTANPRAPEPTWVPVTIAPPDGQPAPATLPPAAPRSAPKK